MPRPQPVTTPSPSTFWSCIPNSVQRCVTKRSSSTNEPGSEEEVDPLAGGELPGLVLFLDPLGPAADERLGVHRIEAFEVRRGEL